MAYLVKPGTLAEDLAAQREYAQSLLGQASSTKPAAHWSQILAQMAQGALGGYEQYELGQEGKRSQDEAADLYQRALGALGGDASTAGIGGAAGGAVAAPTMVSPAMGAAAAAGRAMPMGQDDLVDSIINVESGGNPNARNPRSSATGPGQFIDSTWLAMMRGEPEAQGRTPAEILAMRKDPAISRRMTGKYAAQNQRALQASGMEATPANTYLAHFLGPAGARSILSTRDNVPASQVLQPDQIASNPFLARMTAGDVKRWASNKMAREARVTGGAAPAAAGPAAAPAQAGNPRLAAAAELFRNPTTRPVAGQILQAELAKGKQKPEVVTIELGNGQKRSMMQMPDGSLQPIQMPGGADAGEIPPNFEDSQKLRKEFQSQAGVKKFNDAASTYQSMLKSAGLQTAVSDLDMVYGLAKMLDPESVVREGEFETVRKTQAIPDWLMGYYQYLTAGQGKLPAQAREQIMQIAGNRLGSYREQAARDVERFGRLASRYKIDPSLITQDLPEVTPWKAPALEPGAAPAGSPKIDGEFERGPDGRLRLKQ